MLRTRRHAAVLALLAALACALLPGFLDPVAAQGSTAPGLGGVAFSDPTPAAASAACGPDFGGTYTYQVDGPASGAYAGVFTETGSVTLGAAAGSGRQALVALTGAFTIQAADGAVVTGSAWFDPAVGPNPDTGQCAQEWSGFRATAGTDSLRYEATIVTADGRTCTTHGTARLQLSRNSATVADGFTQSFLNDLAAPLAACAGGGDTTAPVLSLPGTVTVNATGPAGAAVAFAVSALDDVDGAVAPVCSAASGGVFPIGTTTVTCTATDATGNAASGAFDVVVRGAAAQLDDLIAAVQQLNAKHGIVNSLDAKLSNARDALAEASAGDLSSSCGKLAAFIHEVEAQAGDQIGAADAQALLAAAYQVAAVLGC